jgi:hypothetical protein
VGCGGETGEATGEERSLPATWTIPDDVCDRLDLVSIIGDSVAAPQQPPRPGTDDVEADRAGCSATAGSGFEVTVDLYTSQERRQHGLDVQDARARLDQPSTWSSTGTVEEVPVENDLAAWAGRSETAGYSLLVTAGSDDLEDARYLYEAVVADDDNLVAVVTVSSTTPASQSTGPEEAAAALAAATAAVPEALDD